ncbi:MAG: hypothetical protein RL757_1741 [Bacteroidota bacterium]|jgi:hypothetical protein
MKRFVFCVYFSLFLLACPHSPIGKVVGSLQAFDRKVYDYHFRPSSPIDWLNDTALTKTIGLLTIRNQSSDTIWIPARKTEVGLFFYFSIQYFSRYGGPSISTREWQVEAMAEGSMDTLCGIIPKAEGVFLTILPTAIVDRQRRVLYLYQKKKSEWSSVDSLFVPYARETVYYK